MTWLRQFSKAAFICNISFLIALLILSVRRQTDQELSSLLIVMGFFLAVIFNLLVNLAFGLLLIRKKSLQAVPAWLRLTNLLFLALQLIFIIK